MEDHPELDPQISAYYARGEERERVSTEHALEGVRTRDILDRFLTPLPAVVLDIGGGAGAYAIPLVEKGYKVHLVDPVAMHVRQAAEAATASGVSLASAVVGDARRLAFPDAAADVVLLLGPLYHLTELEDRLGGLKEAHRVLKPGGMLVAAFISRFAAMYDGFFSGKLLQDEFESIMVRDTTDGQHRNPARQPGWFTTAYFHHPDEIPAELEGGESSVEAVLVVEGPGLAIPDPVGWLSDPAKRGRLLRAIQLVEQEPSLLGAGGHIMAIGRK